MLCDILFLGITGHKDTVRGRKRISVGRNSVYTAVFFHRSTEFRCRHDFEHRTVLPVRGGFCLEPVAFGTHQHPFRRIRENRLRGFIRQRSAARRIIDIAQQRFQNFISLELTFLFGQRLELRRHHVPVSRTAEKIPDGFYSAVLRPPYVYKVIPISLAPDKRRYFFTRVLNIILFYVSQKRDKVVRRFRHGQPAFFK